MVKSTFYDALQISQNAETAIIEAAYKVLQDRYQNSTDPEKSLAIIKRAYEVLSDPAKRSGYDAALADDVELQVDQAETITPGTQSTSSKVESNAAGEENPVSGTHSLDIDVLYEAAIGEKNTAYYLTKFRQFDQSGGRALGSWNWPAFFLGCPWALYRKMYGWFFVYLIIALLINAAEKLQSGQSGILLPMLFLALPITFGVFANSLYHNTVKKKITAAKLTMKDDAKVLAYFHHAGGVNIWVVWAMWIFGFIIVLGIVAAIALPFYQDNYSKAKTGLEPFNGTLDQSAAKDVTPWDNDPIEQPTKQGDGLFDDVLKPQQKKLEQPSAGNPFDQFDQPSTSSQPSTDLRQGEPESTVSEEAHFNAIRAVHPDLEQVVQSEAFSKWVESRPPALREQYHQVIDRGTADQVIEMLTAFKATL